jgi:5-methyltetrahydrofolate--homocysteine methyltransferase
MPKKSIQQRLKDKILVFDGAMGTNLQSQNLSIDDFDGIEGCNEYLIYSKPEAIQKVHSDFLSVGCDVIETNTFGASAHVLNEYGLQDKTYDINFKAGTLAVEIAKQFSKPNHPKFVAGSIGSGTKLPTLQHIHFDDLEKSFYVQIEALIEAGVDLLAIETVQDILQAKAALSAAFKIFKKHKKRLPLMLSVTIESNGTMLLGTEVSAALTAFQSIPIDIFGLNCATGPMDMKQHIQTISKHSPFPLSVIPNAGLPENIDGKMQYHLDAEQFANELTAIAKQQNVSILGGCCGTTSAHIKKITEAAEKMNPPIFSQKQYRPAASSLFAISEFQQNPKPFIIGERLNANGSKKFRELLLSENLEGIVHLAKEQMNEGVHAIDLCLAFSGRDEVKDFQTILPEINTQITVPIVIDSTKKEVIEASLKKVSGKAIINSINLEDGEANAIEVIELAVRFGASLIALTIDEKGMAKTAEAKFKIAQRIIKLCETNGLKQNDIFIDPLTFTLASGDEEMKNAAVETLRAIELIKSEYPSIFISLGISNISFGFKPKIRKILNSVFLDMAIKKGLDAAILHAGKILPFSKINAQQKRMMQNLILNRSENHKDPLHEILAYDNALAKQANDSNIEDKENFSIEDQLRRSVMDGELFELDSHIHEVLKSYQPLEVINEILLPAMKEVGRQFSEGGLQLPFVLKSAEVMKKAVGLLEPRMDKSKKERTTTMLLATVRGDVHDIGKNLVDIVLSNNGYHIINLGIKAPIEKMVEAYRSNKIDVIGMSGLLVKSTEIMKENLEYLNANGISAPVILGGAALTASYVQYLESIYQGKLFYAADAFAGLKIVENLEKDGSLNTRPNAPDQQNSKTKNSGKTITAKAKRLNLSIPSTAVYGKNSNEVQHSISPPFWGGKIVTELNNHEIYPYINKPVLFNSQWGYKKIKDHPQNLRFAETVFSRLAKEAIEKAWLKPVAIYGYFPCLAVGDHLSIFKNPNDDKPAIQLQFPRQTKKPYRCLTDFFDDKRKDLVAFHLVSAGLEASSFIKELYHNHDYQEYLFAHGFSVQFTEALAEYWHRQIRKELNIYEGDSVEIKQLYRNQFQGCRYSFGYSVCPDLSQQKEIFRLLKPERAGIQLTEAFQIIPEQSTTAIISFHPDAAYFNV